MSNVTLKDIAKLANISPAAVSIILNDKPSRISETKKQEVKKIAKELKINYEGIDWKMELINKNLRENKYIFKIEKEIERNSWENKIDKDKSKGLGR